MRLRASTGLTRTSRRNTLLSDFGGIFLRLHVGPQSRSFSAHEDLLCKQSAYLKNRFQEVRKPVEGDCVICHEDLDALAANLTYCKTCGNNLHLGCVVKWFDTNSTCPTCRAEWVQSSFFRTVNLDDIDADGFEVFLHWVYARSIPTYKADKGDDELRCTRMIDAHIVGEVHKDSEFVRPVRLEIIKCSLEMTDKSRDKLIVSAYQKTDGPCVLRGFFIDLYALKSNQEFIKERATPVTIVEDLFVSLLEKARAKSDKDVWSSMSATGHIEQDEMGIGEGEEAGNEDPDG